MAECPRCGGRTEQLHRLPPELLADPITAGGPTGGTDDSQVCRWCLNELMEK